MRIGVLNPRGPSAGLVDRIDRDAVLAAAEYLGAVEIDGMVRTVRHVDVAAVGMHVDGAGKLMRLHVAAVGQSIAGESGFGLDLVAGHAEHVKLAAPFIRNIQPGPTRMKIDG